MAARLSLSRSGAGVAALAGALSASTMFGPRNAYAESPEAAAIPKQRKPIYDDDETLPPPITTPAPSNSRELNPHTPPPSASTPSWEDRLAVHIKSGRLQVYEYSASAEKQLNDFLTRTLRFESAVTSRIAALAPPRDSGEKLMPGLLYVLVASMAGSIVSRNRGFILRLATPPIFGVATAYQVVPLTMRNVEGLVWEWEEKYPAIAQGHIQAQERISRFVETGKAHSQMGIARVEESLADARRKMEAWVQQGR